MSENNNTAVDGVYSKVLITRWVGGSTFNGDGWTPTAEAGA